MTLTYSLTEAAEKIPCTERWLKEGLRAGRFPGRKIARAWRLTDADIAAVVEISAAVLPAPVSITDGLSLAAKRRIRRRLSS